jgi:hypothetical protein
MMSTRRGKPSPVLLLLATRLVVVVVALLGPLAAASTARADPSDDKLLGLMQYDGITDDSPEAAFEAGHKVCEKLDGGMTPAEVALDVLFSSRLPSYDSGFFVGSSISAYCPQHTPQP